MSTQDVMQNNFNLKVLIVLVLGTFPSSYISQQIEIKSAAL